MLTAGLLSPPGRAAGAPGCRTAPGRLSIASEGTRIQLSGPVGLVSVRRPRVAYTGMGSEKLVTYVYRGLIISARAVCVCVCVCVCVLCVCVCVYH